MALAPSLDSVTERDWQDGPVGPDGEDGPRDVEIIAAAYEPAESGDRIVVE